MVAFANFILLKSTIKSILVHFKQGCFLFAILQCRTKEIVLRLVMAVLQNPHHTPEILALLDAIEKRFGYKPETTTHFIALSYAIESVTDNHLSASTLKRLWGYVNNLPAPRATTLDILSQYVGHKSFRAFCEWLRAKTAETSAFFQTSYLIPEELTPGTLVELGWEPDRLLLPCLQRFPLSLAGETVRVSNTRG